MLVLLYKHSKDEQDNCRCSENNHKGNKHFPYDIFEFNNIPDTQEGDNGEQQHQYYQYVGNDLFKDVVMFISFKKLSFSGVKLNHKYCKNHSTGYFFQVSSLP